MTRVISKVNIRFLSLENPFCICTLLDTDQTFQACQSTLQLWAENSNSSLINGMEKKAKNGGNNWIDYVLLINCGIVLNIYWFWRVLSWTLELIWWWSRWFNCWGTSCRGCFDASSLIFWLCWIIEENRGDSFHRNISSRYRLLAGWTYLS